MTTLTQSDEVPQSVRFFIIIKIGKAGLMMNYRDTIIFLLMFSLAHETRLAGVLITFSSTSTLFSPVWSVISLISTLISRMVLTRELF